jgi:serine phosphatase RsbU (regulator of sigma subunit)
MAGNDSDSQMQKWSVVLLDSETARLRNDFREDLARLFYSDIQRTQHLFEPPHKLSVKDFDRLPEEEKEEWYRFVDGIPGKMVTVNLKIRRFNDFCRTCLIPYSDLEFLARFDYDLFCLEEGFPDHVPFQDMPEQQRRFFIELNHLIPVELKKKGYEIIRPEEIAEINEKLVGKLARAIHSKYQHQIRKQNSVPEKDIYMSWIHNAGENANKISDDFDHLPEEIKQSNLDNAYHIPTKLLAAGYKIRPFRKGFKQAALHLSEEEIETMAMVEHIRWCWDKILNGWYYGKTRDDKKKLHPSIIPYEDLSESEKEKDRELIRLIPALLQDIDYEAFPVNPDKISKLPYAIKPQSSVHRILDESRELNDQIRKLVDLTPALEEMFAIRNRKIEEAIREVEGSYLYAQHIQESFLPHDLDVRECFADSFVLFRPKDIVSGDFYFFSRLNHKIIFAAADCTGHGIPGALLSTIGYGILDQAVNELKMTDPSDILRHLYSRMHRFIKQGSTANTGITDDMDIALCSLDLKKRKLVYSGIGNPLYHISGGEFFEYKAGNVTEPCDEKIDCDFTSETMSLKHGDVIYLFTDGYADQFGGMNHKKYQSGRLKEILRSISNYPMPEQSDILFEEIEKWREANNEEQTDDILVIGIRI